MQDCNKSLTQVLKRKQDSIAALFLLLKISAYVEKYEKKFRTVFSKKARDYALKIQKLDNYLGYMAWAEIYIS